MSYQKNKKKKYLERTLWVLALVCVLPFLAAWASRAVVSHLTASPAAASPLTNSSLADNPVSDNPVVDNPVVDQHRAGNRLQASSSGVNPPELKMTASGHGVAETVDTAAITTQPGSSEAMQTEVPEPNQGLWSQRRLSAFDRLRETFAPDMIGTLVFASSDERVPVFSGDNVINMTLGAGHLQDSAPLDGSGNIAITAHRDGAFRVLKDIKVGDILILQTTAGERMFSVASTQVVTPDRVDVLDDTEVPTLTLITCHPFYYVGSAPNRFIVQAEVMPTEVTPTAEAVTASFTGALPADAGQRPIINSN